MAITKNKLVRNFSICPNEIIIDTSVSSNALRVYLYLLSKPDGWEVYNSDVCKAIQISEDTLTKCWKILLDTGWITREHNINKAGQFVGGYVYVLHESPISTSKNITQNEPNNTESGKNPKSEKPRILLNTDINSKTNKKINKKDFVYADVEDVFKFWQQTMNKPKAKLDDKRARDISKQLSIYSVEELKKAIIGCSKSPFHMGFNPQRTAYNQINNIFGNSDRVEKFIELSNNSSIPANSHDLSTQSYDNAQEHFDVPVNELHF